LVNYKQTTNNEQFGIIALSVHLELSTGITQYHCPTASNRIKYFQVQTD